MTEDRFKGMTGTQLSRYPGRLDLWLSGRNPGPLTIEVGITHGCNHNCLHCSFQQSTPYKKQKKFIDPDLFMQFLKDFREMGGVEIYFAGDGEPLLHPQIEEFLACCKQLGLGVSMSSNGIYLTEKKATDILRYLDWIRFSINGGDRDTYAKIHDCDPKDFDRLSNNLINSVRIRHAQNSKVLLAIQFLVYDLNYQSMVSMLEFHKVVGTDLLVFRSMSDTRKDDDAPSQEIREALREIEASVGEFSNVKVRLDFHTEAKWKYCYGPNFRIYMNHEGDIIPCFRQYYNKNRIGNIHKNRFTEIWNSERKSDVYKMIESGGDISMCSRLCHCSQDNIVAQNACLERGGK
ncbi:MAG: radical SAM protein [Magnetococcus sp. THC-1_WYH]